MPTCKILFFLLLALCTSYGECDEFVKYGKVGGEVSMDCGVSQDSDVEWKLNDILIVKINGKSGTRRKGPSHIKDRVGVSGGTLKVSRLETRDSGVFSCNSRKRYTLHVVSGEGPLPELSMVHDILGVDSTVLAGISGSLESEAEPEQHNTEPSQQSKQLQHQQSATNSMPNQAATKKKQLPSSAATREELLELQRDVLQLQKIKLQLEIEKLKKEKENQDL